MTACVVCQLDNRTPERGQVCEPDRARISHNLRDIGDLYQRIDLQPGRAAAGSRPTGKPGSRLPLLVDPLDLTMPGRALSIAIVDSESYPREQQLADQIGHIAVASVLDSWVRDWCEVRDRGERLPVPTVSLLVDWLFKRLGWACDEHRAIDEFAAEVRHLHSTLRAVCGETEPRPERLWVPCPRCDLLALRRMPGEAYPIRCASCPYAGTEEEYERYGKLYGAAVKRGDFPPPEPVDMVVLWHQTGEQVMVA